MLPTLFATAIIAAVIIKWAISTQGKLLMLDDNISNAMNQIGVQLSGRFDFLLVLLDLIKPYAKQENEVLIETIKSSRSMITAKSSPDDVLGQEEIISQALIIIELVAGRYPELRGKEIYINTMDGVQTFENMLRTSRLIYNDSVGKLNCEIQNFPVSIIAGMLGFKARSYLEEELTIMKGSTL